MLDDCHYTLLRAPDPPSQFILRVLAGPVGQSADRLQISSGDLGAMVVCATSEQFSLKVYSLNGSKFAEFSPMQVPADRSNLFQEHQHHATNRLRDFIFYKAWTAS